MKKKLVGIFVMTLLIATAMSAVGTINEKETPAIFGIKENSDNQPEAHSTILDSDRGALFMQLPYLPHDSGYGSWVSDLQWDARCYENFWEVTSPICDIHWWGRSFYWDGTRWWPNCDPEGMKFNITFYEETTGFPGDIVCSYVDVTPSIIDTGILYWGSMFQCYVKMYYFEYNLDPCCNLSNGWVSIQNTYCPSNCSFLWTNSPDGNSYFYQYFQGDFYKQADNLAFILTDGEPADPEVGCEGKLNWPDVKPGEIVNGSFLIGNTGDNGSVLQWRIDNSSLPTWGSNWTFSPSSGLYTTDMGLLWVNVSVTAPPEENKKLSGKIKVVNAVDPSEFCEIDVSLNTPKSRATYNTLILKLFERFPNLLPIIQYILRFQ